MLPVQELGEIEQSRAKNFFLPKLGFRPCTQLPATEQDWLMWETLKVFQQTAIKNNFQHAN